MRSRTISLLCTILLLAACGRDSQQPPQLFKEQRDALEKAKAVDAEMQKRAAEQQKAIDQQTKE
jgi:hypothetical protein